VQIFNQLQVILAGFVLQHKHVAQLLLNRFLKKKKLSAHKPDSVFRERNGYHLSGRRITALILLPTLPANQGLQTGRMPSGHC